VFDTQDRCRLSIVLIRFPRIPTQCFQYIFGSHKRWRLLEEVDAVIVRAAELNFSDSSVAPPFLYCLLIKLEAHLFPARPPVIYGKSFPAKQFDAMTDSKIHF
jgi:hypothetical protein